MSLCSGLLWGVGLVRVWLIVFCFAAVVDVLLDVLLIPAHAEVGAAWANNSAQVTASLLVVGYTVRKFGPLDWECRVLVRGGGCRDPRGVRRLGLRHQHCRTDRCRSSAPSVR